MAFVCPEPVIPSKFASMTKRVLFLSLLACFLPAAALANGAGEKEPLHVFVELVWGPIGAVAGIMAMVIFWRISRQVDRHFSYLLKMLVISLLCFNVAAVSFGFHGSGLLDGETTVEITSTFRMLGLVVIDIAAVVLFAKMTQKSSGGQEGTSTG